MKIDLRQYNYFNSQKKKKQNRQKQHNLMKERVESKEKKIKTKRLYSWRGFLKLLNL